MNTAAISLIIPTYNEAERIQPLVEMLKDLQLQLPKMTLEFIFVDGYSTDETYVLLQRWRSELFPYLKFYQTSKGRGNQLHFGAKMASYPLLLFLHADSVITADYLTELCLLPSNQPIWGCGKLAFDDPKRIFRFIEKFSNLRAKLLSVCLGDQGLFATKNLYFLAGGFQSIPIMEDLFFSKIAKKIAKPTILKAQILTSSRRYHQLGIYKTIYRMQMVKLLYTLGKNPQQLKEYYLQEDKAQRLDRDQGHTYS